MVDLINLNCDGCPARHLRDMKRIHETEKFRLSELAEVGGRPELILLGESAPANRFVYDLTTDYSTGGLRFNLKKQLLPGGGTDYKLLEVLRKRRIWIVDGALCPLHQLATSSARRHATTLCMGRHTRPHLDLYPKARVFTFFPANAGFSKREMPDLARRIEKDLPFSLTGLSRLVGESPQ